jgi:hypothetical protein
VDLHARLTTDRKAFVHSPSSWKPSPTAPDESLGSVAGEHPYMRIQTPCSIPCSPPTSPCRTMTWPSAKTSTCDAEILSEPERCQARARGALFCEQGASVAGGVGAEQRLGASRRPGVRPRLR